MFCDFVEDGQNVMKAWIASLPGSEQKSAKAKFNKMILAQQQIETLTRQSSIGRLTGECDGFYELIFYAGPNGIPYRPIFCKGPRDGQLTFLVGARKNQDKVFIPRNACAIAQRRWPLIGDPGNVVEHDFS